MRPSDPFTEVSLIRRMVRTLYNLDYKWPNLHVHWDLFYEKQRRWCNQNNVNQDDFDAGEDRYYQGAGYFIGRYPHLIRKLPQAFYDQKQLCKFRSQEIRDWNQDLPSRKIRFNRLLKDPKVFYKPDGTLWKG